MEVTFAWSALLLLGAVHGINPAMGWLFAVSLGLQEGERRAVWGAMLPLAVGHAVAIAAALAAAVLLGRVMPLDHLKWVVALLLVGLGIAQLVRHRHPRWGGMRVGPRDLAIWSFLMASAHGAGLMAVPFLLGAGGSAAGSAGGHADLGAVMAGAGGDWLTGLAATAVHTAGYLAVTLLAAVVVYEWLGLRLLRTAWINVNLLWAAALILTGVLTPLL